MRNKLIDLMQKYIDKANYHGIQAVFDKKKREYHLRREREYNDLIVTLVEKITKL